MLKPGTYKATRDLILNRKRSNSIGSVFHTPSLIESQAIKAGETFEVPETANGYFFSTDPHRAAERIDRG